jgi:hypothetical protein
LEQFSLRVAETFIASIVFSSGSSTITFKFEKFCLPYVLCS